MATTKKITLIDTLNHKSNSGATTWDIVGLSSDVIFKGTESLTLYLDRLETRLANIEACLKEVAQEDGLIFNKDTINPVG